MTRDIILAIDNGTQSVRALLFDLRGNLLAKSRVLSTPQSSPEPGWAEQDPEIYWAELCQACQQLWQQTDVSREAIAGVALTTQRSTVVNVDRAGVPLRPAIIWLDQRRTYGLKPVGGMWGLAFAATGMTETAAYLQAEAECQLDPHASARRLDAHPQVPVPLRLSDLPADGTLRRLGGLPGGLRAIRLQRAALGRA